MKKLITKNNLTKFLCLTLILCLMLAVFPSLFIRAKASETINEIVEDVNISQSQFDSSSLIAPYEPTSWTGSYIDMPESDTVKGIISLDSSYIDNYDNIKLSVYPEFKDKNFIPDTPFGKTSINPSVGHNFPGTNRNVLMINALSTTAYGYSSEDITLESNSFYRFSVYVKTGMFLDENSGAAVTLTGLKEAVGIWNIDTFKYVESTNGIPVLTEENMFGFIKYTINVATGNNSETVKLKLSVGDNIEGHIHPSKGYAFFDNVQLVRYSPTPFYNTLIENEFSEFYDMNSYEYLKDSQSSDIGSFENGITGWQRIVEKDNDNQPIVSLPMDFNTYDGGFFNNSAFGLTSDPSTPRGKAQADNKIMILTSYDKTSDSFKYTRGGIKSSDIKIDKESYYILTVWYNTQELEGSVAIVVSGESTVVSKGFELEPVVAGELSSDNNEHRYGWQRKEFAIQGSMFKDVNINVELWLGRDGDSKGIAMFDDITLTKVDRKAYTEASSGASTVVIDQSNNTPSSSVSNGYFSYVEYNENEENEVSYPLNPQNWTFNSTDSAKITGRSATAVNTDSAVYGVVPTEYNHYNAHMDDYLLISNPYSHEYAYSNKNVLLMASRDNTAFCYSSSEINIGANGVSEIKVNLLANMSGYGANLILKKDNRIVASIEKILSTNNNFKEYTFYVSGSNEDSSLTLEIWFGFVDKGFNSTKLANGYMFVDYVTIETASTDIEQKATEYNSYPDNPSRFLDYAVYKMNGYDFSAYDRFSDDIIKESYNFTVSGSANTVSGIIAGLPSSQNIIPSYFYKASGLTENRFDSTLYLQNTNVGYSRLSSNNTFSLEADSFYKIDFSVLVHLGTENNSNSIGGGIYLNNEGFTDIKDTLDEGIVIGNDENGLILEQDYIFKTFSFYFATGTEAENVSWYISLGNDDAPNQAVSGRIYCNYVSINPIELDSYNSDIESLEEEENQYFFKIDNRMESPVEDIPVEDNITDNNVSSGNTNNNPWLLVPSILFAIAILIVLVGVVVKKLWARKPRNRNRERVVSYDRKRIGEEDFVATSDKVFESFDDELKTDDSKQLKTKDAVVSEVSQESTSLDIKDDSDINEFDD